ncbi:MAG: S8 family serine peptidase [Oscillospiraceae bacterium]|nr:S8 family serine peptidase [Oscillospiraceae bacterium]
MKKNMFRRGLALVMACVMVLSLGVGGVQAAQGVTARPLESVSADLMQGNAIEHKNENLYADTDTVRVMIVLEEEPAVGKLKGTENFVENIEAVSYRAELQAKQEKLANDISVQALKGQKLDVVWNLTLMANAISANVRYGDIEKIAKVQGVEKIYLETVYYPQTAEPSNIVAQEMTGANVAHDTYGYTGAGTVVAVVDTGTDPDHQSFSEEGYLYALAQNAEEKGMELDAYMESLELMDVEHIASVLDQLNVSKRIEGVTAEQLYANAKRPFNFNYVDGTFDVSHDLDEMGSHGSHVAGIAAANRYIPVGKACDLNGDGACDLEDAQLLMDHVILGTEAQNLYHADLNSDGVLDERDVTALLDAINGGFYADAAKLVGVTGVAPDAQIVTMKVFGVTGGAYSSDYMAATEDAMILGCDSVNLSLGGANPGFSSSHEVEASDSAYIDDLMERLADSGIVMCVSAGNSGNWADNDNAYQMMYADEGGSYTTSEPSTYANALSIASADNVGLVTDLKTSFGTTEFRMEGVSGGFNEPWISLDSQSQGVTFEAVFIGDPTNLLNGQEQTDMTVYGGSVEDYVDVTGKVVLVARGNQVAFADKHANGALAGAAAVIIYNNVTDPIYASIEGSEATIPCATITLEQAREVFGIFGGCTGTFTVEHKLNVNHGNGDGKITMSDFSSWGTTGDLALKPEITAPGGSIYSVNGVDPSGTAYEQMSGTSMSAPHVAGLTALVSQYIEDKGLSEMTGMSKRALAQSLLMSTAEVIMEGELPYSVRNQGAGLASIENVIKADSYITVEGQPDGKVKAELGHGTGERKIKFTVNNLTDSEQTYQLSAQIMTSGVTMIDGHALATDEMMELPADVYFSCGDQVTVPAMGAVEISVVISVSEETAAAMEAKGFENGFYIEGFVYAEPVADDEGAVGASHSIPMLGWYGNWSDPSMYEANEHIDFAYNTLERPAHIADFSTNILSWAPKGYGSGMYYSGNIYGSMNTETGEAIGDSRYIEARNAVNSEHSIWELYAVYPTLIRNAADYKLTVFDSETGEVYYVNDYEGTDDYMLSSFFYTNYGQWYNTTTESPVDLSMWEFTDAEGSPLPEDTKFTIELACAPDYFVREDGTVNWDEIGEGAYLRWNFHVDNTNPELVGDLKLEGDSLHFTVKDNNYVAAVILLTGDASGAVNYVFPDMDEDARGTEFSGTLDLTGYREYFGQKAAIAVCDYAGNESYYAINLGGEGESYGDLVAFRYDAGGYIGSWVSFSEGVARNETGLFPATADMVAAEYVNGLVFAQDNSGNLYGIRYEDLLANSVELEECFITKLENVYQDFAYNYSNGKLYALSTYEDGGAPTTELYTVNLKGSYYDEEEYMEYTAYQEDWAASRGGVYGLALAIDSDGSVYILGPNWDAAAEDTTDTAHLWKAAMVSDWSGTRLGAFQEVGDTGMGMDYLQSMTFDHNTGSLYWAQFYPRSFLSMETNLVKLDPKTAAAEIVGELSYETAAMFAPLTAETAAKEEFANVPEFDSSVLPTPALSMGNLTMGVGNSQQLTYVCDPWYANNKEMVWSSSDESVATVDQNGVVTAVSDGACTVTVASAGDAAKFDTCEVTVASLTLNVEGIISRTEGGLNSVWGSKLYNYSMVGGSAAYTEGAFITAPEEYQGFGLNIGSAIEARGSIWACEFGNAGMIYEIDKDTGAVKNLMQPIDGDMMFGFDYSEATDRFAAIMNFYFYADLSMDEKMYEDMKDSYDESIYQYTYHKFDMSEHLRASDKGFNTGETNQGSIVDVVFCGITAVDNTGKTSYYATTDYQGNMCGESTYTPVTTHVIMDNVGRMWYIDEVRRMNYVSDEYGNSFYVNADGTSMISGDNKGVFSLEVSSGIHTVFVIRKIEETPMTDMYRNGTLPRMTYHFSDLYYAGETEEGAPMFFVSLYDYWHEGTTNELYLYVGGIGTGEYGWDENWNRVEIMTPASLYDLGDTGFGNIIATITSAEVIDGLPAIEMPDTLNNIGTGIYKADR